MIKNDSKVYILKFFLFRFFLRSWWLTIKSIISPNRIKIGKGAFISRGSRIKAGLTVGDHTCITGPIFIKGHGKVKIGKFCAFGEYIDIITTNHRTDYANLQYHVGNLCGFDAIIDNKGVVEIGNNVWIGDRVIIMPGVKIGDGAVVGAGTLVTKDIEPFAIVVGIPGHEQGKRFSQDIIALLLEIRWWDWPINKIKKNAAFFNKNLRESSINNLESIIIQ